MTEPLSRKVVLIVFPGFQLLDAAGPISVFEAASYFAGEEGGYDVTLASAKGECVRSSAGVVLDTVALDSAPRAETLMVAGGPGTRSGTRAPGPDPGVVSYLRDHAAFSKRVASVCTGAFLLAEAGLLDGRRATTHWRHAASLARRYPAIDVVPDRVWVQDGRYWSSAGVAAGIDLALALVAEDLGSEVARRAAREVVVYYQRPGGQSQFSTVEELCDPRGRFAHLLAWIRSHLAAPLKVEELADRMAMSPRNFSRRFRAETGLSPAQAVTRIRLEVARALVESTERPVTEIARETGFGDAERMRRAFVRFLGRPPRALRTGARRPAAPSL